MSAQQYIVSNGRLVPQRAAVDVEPIEEEPRDEQRMYLITTAKDFYYLGLTEQGSPTLTKEPVLWRMTVQNDPDATVTLFDETVRKYLTNEDPSRPGLLVMDQMKDRSVVISAWAKDTWVPLSSKLEFASDAPALHLATVFCDEECQYAHQSVVNDYLRQQLKNCRERPKKAANAKQAHKGCVII